MKKICATASLGLLLTICNVSVGAETKKVSTDELERQLHAGLVEQGRLADSIDCPDELDKGEGAEVKCISIINGVEYIMTVTFDGVDGDVNKARITEVPNRVTPDGLAHGLKTELEELEEKGKPADVIDCPDALDAGEGGSKVECTVVRKGHRYTVTAMSNGVDASNGVDVYYAFSNWRPRGWLARHIQTVLKERTGTSLDSVDCPDDLDLGEGSAVACTLVDNGLEFTATLTSKGSNIDLLTAENPNRFTREGLEAHVARTVTDGAGRNPDNVTCPREGLIAKVGRTQRCTVTTGADQFDVTVTATSVENGNVDYNIRRDGRP